MKDYRVLSQPSIEGLDLTVKAHLEDGWLLAGGVAVLPVHSKFIGEVPQYKLLQAVVRENQ